MSAEVFWNPKFEQVIEAMIAEQGEMWAESADFKNRSEMHNAVVITDRPDHCYRLVLRDGAWAINKDALDFSEMAEFFAAFGSHWTIMLNSHLEISSGLIKVRAFIKNGRRKTTGFSISV